MLCEFPLAQLVFIVQLVFITDEGLLHLFAGRGFKPVSARVITDWETGRSRGFGFAGRWSPFVRRVRRHCQKACWESRTVLASVRTIFGARFTALGYRVELQYLPVPMQSPRSPISPVRFGKARQSRVSSATNLRNP